MLEAVEGARDSGSYAIYAKGRARCALYARGAESVLYVLDVLEVAEDVGRAPELRALLVDDSLNTSLKRPESSVSGVWTSRSSRRQSISSRSIVDERETTGG